MIENFLMYALPFAGVVIAFLFLLMAFRRVVSTNMVHIVQSSKKTTSYGTGLKDGNVYYKWPSSLPLIGVTVIELPVSNFDLSLEDYEAYDKDRVPFVVHVTAFFRILDTRVAAQRVKTVQELHDQLSLIVQGAVRKVLASDNIDTVMLERSKFGDAFTAEVGNQLDGWGVESVKSMELMDIRDSQGSKVIDNIMAKKKSQIEMESRVEVAENMKTADVAEIQASQLVEVRAQEKEQAVGERTAEKEKSVGIADQKARQQILTEEEETETRKMAVKRVEQVKSAQITRDEMVVAAEQDKQTTVIIADGNLEAKKKEAEGIEAIGIANGEAEKAMQLAPVKAQIELAQEIGNNQGYQEYLVQIKTVEAHMVVGSIQAEALKQADVKVISNTGNPTKGLDNVMDMFTSAGGTNLAGMLEGLAQSPMGEALLELTGIDTKAGKKTANITEEEEVTSPDSSGELDGEKR